MVGMVIGLLGIIVMMQVFSLSEERKRTATAGSDAQNNVAIALDGMQRDIAQSGYGLTQLLNCLAPLPSGVNVRLAPVIINPADIPAGDENTDTIQLAYGIGDDLPHGLNTGTGVLKNTDWVIPAPTSWGGPRTDSTFCDGSGVTPALQQGNPGTGFFNLGSNPRFLVYAIRSGNLTVCNFRTSNCTTNSPTALADQTIWQPIASNVVSMRAQYAQDSNSPMDGIIDTYNQTTPTNECGWKKAPAVRLVLVARSNQKQTTTVDAPTWAGNANAPIDLSEQADWANYRYRAYEILVPIRNIAWMEVSGC